MGFSLGDMFLSALLFTNAAAILHEKRFLNQCACAHLGPAHLAATPARPPPRRVAWARVDHSPEKRGP
jgi:hypothetical protein